MKNTKFSKIALLVLSVAILVGCALAFSVSAEEAPADNAILAQNLVYGDKVAVAYAINASIEDAAAEFSEGGKDGDVGKAKVNVICSDRHYRIGRDGLRTEYDSNLRLKQDALENLLLWFKTAGD